MLADNRKASAQPDTRRSSIDFPNPTAANLRTRPIAQPVMLCVAAADPSPIHSRIQRPVSLASPSRITRLLRLCGAGPASLNGNENARLTNHHLLIFPESPRCPDRSVNQSHGAQPRFCAVMAPKGSRRFNGKSRNGCRQCKRRRVKVGSHFLFFYFFFISTQLTDIF